MWYLQKMFSDRKACSFCLLFFAYILLPVPSAVWISLELTESGVLQCNLQSHFVTGLPTLCWKAGSNTSLRVAQVGWINQRWKSSPEKAEEGILPPPSPSSLEKLVGVRMSKAVPTSPNQANKTWFLLCLFAFSCWFPFPCPVLSDTLPPLLPFRGKGGYGGYCDCSWASAKWEEQTQLKLHWVRACVF